MLRSVLCVLLLLSAPAIAAPQTWYVRTDGADLAHCSGLVDAPYTATAAGKCAVSSLLYLLPPNRDGNDVGRKPVIAGGDIVKIGPGQFQQGLPFNGGSWGSCNAASWPYDCVMQPVPSGTAAQPTQILGAGSALTQIWGSGGAATVINLTGSSYVVIKGLEITDHANCIEKQHDLAVQCQPGGLWAANGISDTSGSADNPASTNVTLSDVYIHGLGKFGLNAGHIANWTLDTVRIIGNGFGGWSLDTGPNSPSSGTNTMTNSEIGWNGCTENYPTPAIWGCWGQETGGYGDGVGSSSASDTGTWIFRNVYVHDNVQDGIDFLHANPSATILYDHVNAQRNAGNQLKGGGSITVTNSILNADCSALQGLGDMKGDNSNGGASSGDNCRAGGDANVFSLSSNHTATFAHNTVLSQGDCVITIADADAFNNSTGDATSKLVVTDNAVIGLPGWDFNPDIKPSCLYYWNAENTGQYKTNLVMTNNVVWKVGGTVPAGNLVADPLLANETLQKFDPTPLAGSPLLGKASDGTNIGAVQSAAPPTPPAPRCTGGIVSAGTCYCPAGTTSAGGDCGALPKPAAPVISCTVNGAVATCTASGS